MSSVLSTSARKRVKQRTRPAEFASDKWVEQTVDEIVMALDEWFNREAEPAVSAWTVIKRALKRQIKGASHANAGQN